MNVERNPAPVRGSQYTEGDSGSRILTNQYVNPFPVHLHKFPVLCPRPPDMQVPVEARLMSPKVVTTIQPSQNMVQMEFSQVVPHPDPTKILDCSVCLIVMSIPQRYRQGAQPSSNNTACNIDRNDSITYSKF